MSQTDSLTRIDLSRNHVVSDQRLLTLYKIGVVKFHKLGDVMLNHAKQNYEYTMLHYYRITQIFAYLQTTKKKFHNSNFPCPIAENVLRLVSIWCNSIFAHVYSQSFQKGLQALG